MNPFVSGTLQIDDSVENLPTFTEYAYDFERNDFIYDKLGKHIMVTENEAIKVWIYKSLKTERYRYNAYRHGAFDEVSPYGVEIEQFIGKNINNTDTGLKIKQYIYDGLIINPYIVEIESIDIISTKGYELKYSIALDTIYGALEVQVNV